MWKGDYAVAPQVFTKPGHVVEIEHVVASGDFAGDSVVEKRLQVLRI